RRLRDPARGSCQLLSETAGPRSGDGVSGRSEACQPSDRPWLIDFPIGSFCIRISVSIGQAVGAEFFPYRGAIEAQPLRRQPAVSPDPAHHVVKNSRFDTAQEL